MDTAKKIELLEDMFDMESGELDVNAKLSELDEWDSMAKLSLIVLMDDECGKQLTGDDIKTFETVQDIINFMG
ncbi:MAG: acyl carrier protein [Oscillospiraceae bacterium]|nr:acyl carrier protein [Oscillospiraceae bacterium]